MNLPYATILGYSLYKISDSFYETKAWVKSHESGSTFNMTEKQGTKEECRDTLIKLVASEIKAGNVNFYITQVKD